MSSAGGRIRMGGGQQRYASSGTSIKTNTTTSVSSSFSNDSYPNGRFFSP